MSTVTAQKKGMHRTETHFPIVGIGGATGSSTAFEMFFSAMPARSRSGMAFVLVQHHCTKPEKILTEIVRKHTQMRVYSVVDGMTVYPNCVYIVPSIFHVAFLNNALRLSDVASSSGSPFPIDHFFYSLARNRQKLGICIVLSGNSGDATAGCRAINEAGGMVLVQTPTSATHKGLPESIINAGLADDVLTPAEMPARLFSFAAYALSKKFYSSRVSSDNDARRMLCSVLQAQVGYDFSQYRQTVLLQRMDRRMAICGTERTGDYLCYLQTSPEETKALFRDLLVGMTGFFRDPEAFAILRDRVFPKLFTGQNEKDSVRIWICGCSTGEEAYSIAILIREHLDRYKQNCQVKIFATDIDHRAVKQAQSGIFTWNIGIDVSPERLARFFSYNAVNKTYRIHKVIRDMVVFSVQDVIRDPPFLKMNLICCRNLFVHMKSALRNKLVNRFYDSLILNGVLFLGLSESIGSSQVRFWAMDPKHKVFVRRDDIPSAMYPEIGSLLYQFSEKPTLPETDNVNALHFRYRELTERAAQRHNMPTAVLIDRTGQILHTYGRIENYLEPSFENPARNILLIAREGLQRELATAISRVTYNGGIAHKSNLWVRLHETHVKVHFTIRQLTVESCEANLQELLIVLFETALPGSRLRLEKRKLHS